MDFASDLEILYINYEKWFRRPLTWESFLFPMINRNNEIVPFTKNAFTLFESKFFAQSGVSYHSPYTRKKGAVTLAYTLDDLSDLDKIMLARHSTKRSVADLPKNAKITTHRYCNVNLLTVAKNYERLAHAALRDLDKSLNVFQFCDYCDLLAVLSSIVTL